MSAHEAEVGQSPESLASEERLRLALEAGRMGTWEWDVAANRVAWSPGLEAIHGLAPGTFAGTFEAFQEDVHPEDRGYVQRAVEATLREGTEQQIQYRIVRSDGSVRWVEGRGKLYRDSGGRPLRMLGVCMDVTDRKLAEAAMRANEERYQRLLALMPAAVYTCEAPSGAITFYNEKAAAIWGRRPAPGDSDERFCGSLRLWNVDGSLLPHGETPMALALREGRAFRNSEVVIERPDGSRVPVVVNIDPIRDADGRLIGAINVFHDLGALKETERTLRARVEQQRAVAKLGEFALGEPDLEKVLQHATETLAATLQIEYCKVLELLPEGRELLLRAGVGWREGLAGSARVASGIGSQAGYTLQSKAPVIVAELAREQRFSGPPLLAEHRVVSGMSCVIHGAAGAPWGVLGCHSTRRIEFTQDDVNFLTAVANILSHAIHRDRAEQAMREADRRKDEFLATLSHELRNPLAPIRSALELLRMQTPGMEPAQIYDILERQVNQLIRLVDDLLEISRVERGLVELRRARLRLNDVLASAVETSSPLIEAAGHLLEVDVPPEPLWVEGDPVRLAQVFANLLNNAARFTGRGGRITLAAKRAGTDLEVAVRDTGIGFSAHTRERLFEMFHRSAGSSGLGIGLALARRLVEMHGGTIDARSAGEGAGAEFVIRLPLAAAPAAPAAEAASDATEGEAAAKRVLVADDNRDAAESLGMLLRLLGNDVRVAFDGVEAVEAARTFRPQVALLDVGMPKLDGYGAAREIRRHGGDVRLVALTGWGQEADRRRAREAGFDAHLVKPADLDSLRSVIAGAGGV